MKLTIVTGNQPHMLYLCKKLSEKYDIQGIFFFKTDVSKQGSLAGKIAFHKKGIKNLGLIDHWFVQQAYAPLKKKGHPLSFGYQEADEAFSEYTLDSINIDGEIHHCEDINSDETAAKIKALNSDLVVCHGGPIYRDTFINAGKMVVNYHSGISPVYNGAHSHVFALANGHPHLCGGTLMLMNTSIDGGNILSHYFPQVEKFETPKSLFYKNMLGSFALFDDFIEYLQDNQNYVSINQPKALHYYMMKDWGLNKLRSLKKNVSSEIHEAFQRQEFVSPYYREDTEEKAKNLMKNTLTDLLMASS